MLRNNYVLPILIAFLVITVGQTMCSSHEVFIENADGEPVFINGLISAQFWKVDSDSFQKLAGIIENGQIENNKGTMILYDGYDLEDIDFVIIVKGNEDLLPLQEELKVRIEGNKVYIVVESFFELDKKIRGSSFWVRLATQNSNLLINNINKLRANTEDDSIIGGGLSKTKALLAYIKSNPLNFFGRLYYGTVEINNPIYISFLGGIIPKKIGIPNITLFLLIGLLVAPIAFFPKKFLSLPLDAFSIAFVFLLMFDTTYFYIGYFWSYELAALISFFMLVGISIAIIIYARFLSNEYLTSAIGIFIVFLLYILGGFGLIFRLIKKFIHAIFFPIKKVKNMGKDDEDVARFMQSEDYIYQVAEKPNFDYDKFMKKVDKRKFKVEKKHEKGYDPFNKKKRKFFGGEIKEGRDDSNREY